MHGIFLQNNERDLGSAQAFIQTYWVADSVSGLVCPVLPVGGTEVTLTNY